MLGCRNNEDSDGDNATRNRAKNGKKKKRSKADSDHVHHHGGNMDSDDGDQNSQTIGDRVKRKSQHTITWISTFKASYSFHITKVQQKSREAGQKVP